MTAREARKIRRAAERRAKKIEDRQAKASPEETRIPEPSTRAEINRANAQHSTGPKTVEGKDKSKHNSFKHGLYSKELVLPDEDPAELDELRATLRAEHQPADETEGILVNEIAENFWRLRRMRKLEARGMQPENVDGWLQSGLLSPRSPQHGLRRARHAQSHCDPPPNSQRSNEFVSPDANWRWLRSFKYCR